MRLMKRNLKPIWYCLYQGRVPVTDSDGYETGETEISYSDPVELKVNVSPASGQAQDEMFGTLEDYDKVIITDWMGCPIDENSVLFVDMAPEYGVIPVPEPEPDPEPVEEPVEEPDEEEGEDPDPEPDPQPEPEPEKVLLNSYDYIVKRVAKSLNHISYAISRVKVSKYEETEDIDQSGSAEHRPSDPGTE